MAIPTVKPVEHPDFTMDDGDGATLFKFVAHWRFGGDDIELELWAYDRPDAQRRLTAMRTTLTLAGQVKAVIE